MPKGMRMSQRIQALVLSLLVVSHAAFCGAQDFDKHLAGGEFRNAAQLLQRQGANRDAGLAQIASAQSSSGDITAAGATVRQIQSPDSRQRVVEGARGGAGFADFSSLMDLIETTVAPNTWEALGGPSTMAPYPQGVFVDMNGTVKPCEAFSDSNEAEKLKLLLGAAGAGVPDHQAWRRRSDLRCVSLRRLLDELTRQQIDGVPMPAAMANTAGISRVQYVFFDENDIVIAGPVGGVDLTGGWYRDQVSGLNTMRLDFFLLTLSSAISGQSFGCTIDPTRDGLQRAAALSAAVQQDRMPIGKAADEMVRALGMQKVEVFGTAGDTPLGYLMVEADRHMKELALGIHPMPRGAKNYFDMIDAHIDQGTPNELLLRLWFTTSPLSVRSNQEKTVFELAGTPIRLSGQNERAVASGQRGHVTTDFRSEAFVKDFNEHWHDIRTEYPVYGGLESIYQSAAISQLIKKHSDDPIYQSIAQSLAASASSLPRMHATPRQVLSIAKLHTVTHGRKRHHVLLASGGVEVNSRELLISNVPTYPALNSMTQPGSPKVIQRWWWDASEIR